jgi:hypothetical protein
MIWQGYQSEKRKSRISGPPFVWLAFLEPQPNFGWDCSRNMISIQRPMNLGIAWSKKYENIKDTLIS